MKPAILERVAREVGTPAYVYSAERVLENFRRLDAAFAGAERLVCYALKANTNRAVCRLLAAAGAGADIVSGGELARALAAGFPPAKIVFSGVGKTEDEMGAALRGGILSFHVESEEELAALSRAARRLKRKAPFAVRINPHVDAGTHAHIATGLPASKFGVEAPRARALYLRARRDPWLTAVGVHCHIGSQITRVAPYRKALAALMRMVDGLAKAGVELAYADLGGGFGIRYNDERPFSPTELAASVLPELRKRPGLRLLLEPGRFLVGDAGVLLTKVLLRKESSRRRFVVVDAAMNDMARPSLYGAYHEIVPVRPGRGRKVAADVVGPVCESADVLAPRRRVPWPEPGDLWAILQAGAYGFSMSSQYNSRPRAAEVLVTGSSYRLIRRRETADDLVRHEV